MHLELFRRNLPNQFGFGVTGGLKLYGFGVGLLFGLWGLACPCRRRHCLALLALFIHSCPLRLSGIPRRRRRRVCHIIVAVLS